VTTIITNLTTGKLLASPNLNSKFSPSVTISKSPVMNAQPSLFKLDAGKEDSKNFLMKFAGGSSANDGPKRSDQKSKTVMMNNLGINLVGPTVHVNRKVRNNLKNIEEIKPRNQDSKNDYDDLPIIPASKVSNANITRMLMTNGKMKMVKISSSKVICTKYQITRLSRSCGSSLSIEIYTVYK
jgi:hypothetical protein